MSVSTNVLIDFDRVTKATKEFYKKLDDICRSEGLKAPAIARIWPSPPISNWTDIEWGTQPVPDLPPEGGVQLRYTGNDGAYTFLLSVWRSENGQIKNIGIESDQIKAFRKFYEPSAKDGAIKLQRISRRIVDELGANQAIATLSGSERPWFFFSQEVHQPIERLPLEEDGYRFSLYRHGPLISDKSFLGKLDTCFTEVGFVPHAAWRHDRGRDSRIIGWQDRIVAQSQQVFSTLIYKHSSITSGFADVHMIFADQGRDIESASIEIFLPIEELGRAKADYIIEDVRNQLRQHFPQAQLSDVDGV